MSFLKKHLRIYTVIIAVSLVLTACSGGAKNNRAAETGKGNHINDANATSQTGSGAYVESLIGTGGYSDISALTTYKDAVCFVAKKDGLDDKNHIFVYENNAIEPLVNVPAISDTVMGMTLNDQGVPVLLSIKGKYVASETSDMPPVTLSILKDGSFQAIGQPISNQYLSFSLAALDNGGFLVGTTHGILNLDAKGEQKGSIESKALTLEMAVTGHLLNLIEQKTSEESAFSKSLVIYDLDSGKVIKEMPLPLNNPDSTSLLASDGKGSIYIGTKDGIFRLTKGGEKYEQLAEGMSTILGAPNFYASKMVVTGKSDILFINNEYTDKGMTTELLYRYAWEENAVPVSQAAINIVSIFDYSSLRSAISDYQRSHSGVKLNYQTYLPGYNNPINSTTVDEFAELQVKLEDAIRAINTEVLSGNVPDVLVLDGLPLKNYIDKGILEDMSKWAGPRLTDGTWVENIAGAYQQKDGQLPCIPIYFSVPVLWGDNKQVESINSLSGLAAFSQSLPKGRYPLAAYGSELLIRLSPVSTSSWMNEKGRIDFSSPYFTTFLENLKDLQNTIPEPKMVEASDGKEYVDGSVSFDDYLSNKAAFYFTMLNSQDSVITGNSMTRHRGQQAGVSLLPGQSGQKVFYTSQIISVCKASKNKEASYAFLDYLMKEGIKNSLKDYSYFSIDKTSLEKLLSPQDFLSNAQNSKSRYSIQKTKIKLAPLDDALSKRLKEILYTLDTPAQIDSVLMKMMIDEVMPYMNDKKSLEQTISSLSAKTKAYLAE